MADNEFPELLRYDEAAPLLRIATGTLRHWVRDGRIPFVKLGAVTLFRRDALLEFVRERSIDPRRAT